MLTHFGNDPRSWDIEDTGQVGVFLFGNALQVWSRLQDRQPVTVSEASLAFNASPEIIRQAVDEHPWMCLRDDLIEHDGE